MVQALTLVPAEVSAVYNPILQEIFYCIIGLVFIANGVKAFKESSTAIETSTGIISSMIGMSINRSSSCCMCSDHCHWRCC